MRQPIVVDFFVGAGRSGFADQKWFYSWEQLLPDTLESRRLNVRRRYLRVGAVDVLIRSRLQAREIAAKRRKGSILHVVTQLLAGVAAHRSIESPLVVTCFDVIPYRADAFELSAVRSSPQDVARQIAGMMRADAIVTPSLASKDAILERFDLEPKRVQIVPLGVDSDHYRPREVRPETRLELGFAPDRPNLLYVGSEAPRKNLIGVVSAMAELRDCGIETRLVKVGSVSKDWGQPFRDHASDLGLSEAIVCRERVPEEKLPLYYSSADVFLFPSSYEGFGMPVLEAMGCGCPVVTSSASSLPEVAGGAALIVDPARPAELSSAIRSILSDPDLRKDLAERGRRRAEEMTWEGTAERLCEVYRTVLGRA